MCGYIYFWVCVFRVGCFPSERGGRVGSVYYCKWRFPLRQRLQTELGQPSDWWATRQMDGIFWRHTFFLEILLL